MARHIFSHSDIERVMELHFVAKKPISYIAKELGVTHKVITRIIKQNGRIPLNFHKWHYGVFVLKCAMALYKYGVGIVGIADRLEISRDLLKNELIRQGIKIRTQSEQESAKWAIMDEKSRKKQVKDCHIATKGCKKSFKTLEKRAKTMEKVKTLHIGIFESIIADKITSNGFSIVTQKAIGKYNIDIFVNGRIAVEVWGGGWHFYGRHKARFSKRTKEVLNSGHPLIIVNITNTCNIDAIYSNLIRLLNILCSNPSPACEYWMIRSTGDLILGGNINNVNISNIRASKNTVDLAT